MPGEGAAKVVLLCLALVGAGCAAPASRVSTSILPVASNKPVAIDSSAFAPGTCLRYLPTRGNRGATVFVDPGHGGLDTGAMGTTTIGATVEEKDLTLGIGLVLLQLLRAQGYEVVMSRVSDTSVAALGPGDTSGNVLSAAGLDADLRARVACANASGANALLSIHLNAFSDPAVGGAEIIYGAGRSFTASDRALAQAVDTSVLRSLAAAGWVVPDRGVVSDVGQGAPGLTRRARAYHHLLEIGPPDPPWFSHPSTMPGVVAELLFITDPTEASIAASSVGQKVIAQGLSAGFRSWLGEPSARPARRRPRGLFLGGR